MNQFVLFYKCVINKKQFYLPVLFFAIIGYSFSIYNRTVSIDGLLGDYTVGGNGCSMLSGRWGMVVWCRLLGIMGLDPFIDRFLALLFLIIAAVLFCYLLYMIDNSKDILCYSIVASVFVTYPLINEIWEYVGADFMVCANLCLVTLALIVLRRSSSFLSYRKRILLATLLILLPMSSYETGVFFYIALVELVLFYEAAIGNNSSFLISEWIKKNLFYMIPLLFAFIVRFVVSYFINTIYDLEYSGGGNTSVIWLGYDFLPTFKGMIVSNIIHYFVYGLVYFPIAIFVLSFIFFTSYILFNRNRITLLLLGTVFLISLFSQAILQGDLLYYRHAQTITLFVSFSVYLFCVSVKSAWRKSVYVLLLALCWYQAVYLNRLLGLNNLRSDNELAIVRQIGSRIVSEYEKKPVVFVGVRPSLGTWIDSQITVDEASWNGALFCNVLDILGECNEHPIKYVGTNVNTIMAEYLQLKNLFSYCGYDIEVIPDYYSGKVDAQAEQIREDAATIAEEKGIRPYQIYDNEKYLIVNLGGDNMKQ